MYDQMPYKQKGILLRNRWGASADFMRKESEVFRLFSKD